jgi:anti-sigma-K factor RskA
MEVERKVNGKCGWKEEEMIDFVFGNLTESKSRQLQLHLKACSSCQEKMKSWKETVTYEQNTAPPSRLLKKRIDKSINTLTQPKKKKFPKKSTLTIVSCAAIILMVIGLFQFHSKESERYLVQQNEDIQKNKMINDPKTAQFNVMPVSNVNQINGNVWVNDVTNEMLMKVDGLTSLDEKDYQIWTDQSNSHVHEELLQIRDESVQLYYKGSSVNRITFIRVSIEPKGGSQSPTGPETFIVNLKR